MPLEDALADKDRVHYFEGTTNVLLGAIKDGVDLKAYFPWSKGFFSSFIVSFIDLISVFQASWTTSSGRMAIQRDLA